MLLNDWDGLQPTVLMIPIGGLGQNTWTMDVDDALQAVEQVDPEVVIPTDYNVPFLSKKEDAVADDKREGVKSTHYAYLAALMCSISKMRNA